MHMAWMRQVCGRLKSDYRYSAGLVYNNYPWPEALTAAQHSAVETAAQAVRFHDELETAQATRKRAHY